MHSANREQTAGWQAPRRGRAGSHGEAVCG